MKIAYAAPSYRRPHCRTVRYITKTRVYVDPSEYDDYVRENDGYGEIVACADGIQGNLPRVRNYILDEEFGRGADVVVMMDDDLVSLGMYHVGDSGFGYEKKRLSESDVDEFVEYASVLCEEWGFGMWGVNRNEDKLLYKHFNPFSTTRAAVGQFMAFTKDELRFDERLPLKEDYDMGIQQMNRYRGVLLVNFVHANADMGSLAGGTSVRRNFDREKSQFFQFRRKWGSDIVKGTNVTKGQGRSRQRSELLGGYDFSHPIVRVPIKGV